MNLALGPSSGVKYKVFLVEIDDDDRERVLEGRISACVIETERDYPDIHSDHFDYSVARYGAPVEVKLTATMEPIEGDVYFKLTDFTKEEEE